ncbi:hypothetical protein EHM76_07365 [bacterium]|nr:MAG: hypothetical protein EHM76_07365 [bacterium]
MTPEILLDYLKYFLFVLEEYEWIIIKTNPESTKVFLTRIIRKIPIELLLKLLNLKPREYYILPYIDVYSGYFYGDEKYLDDLDDSESIFNDLIAFCYHVRPELNMYQEFPEWVERTESEEEEL